MPFIIKNGKYYGSSADGSVDITQAEYDKLKASGQVNPSITYYITDGEVEDSGGGNANIVELTQEEYDALPESKLTDGVLYAITDGEDFNASNLPYDGNETGLGNTVQEAVDNLDNKISEQNKNLEVVQHTGISLFGGSMIIHQYGKILSCQIVSYMSFTLTSGWHTIEDFLPETLKTVYRQHFNFTTDSGKVVYGFLEGRNLEIYASSNLSQDTVYGGFMAMIE